ncbi:MAG: EamA family transporter [Flavobacteriaceae bacterium]|nr:EamA family transporter [Flavobacteriaceae bacterium]
MSKNQNKFLIVLAFFAIYVIWGSTYMFNKIVVSEIPAFMSASIRFFIASILIFIIAKILGLSLSVTKAQLKNSVIAGFLFLAFGNGGVVWALNHVDSGFAALEISAQPLVVLIMMRVLQKKKIQPMSWVGVAFGIVGIYLLVSQDQLLVQEGSLLSVILIFACMLSWSYASLFVAKADLPSNYFVNTGYQMFFGGILLFFESMLFGEQWISPLEWSGSVQLSMLALIIFGSVVAFTSFNYLLKVVSPEKVATATYVNPIIALLLGWYFLKEEITSQSVLAAVVLLTGVYFINSTKKLNILARFKSKSLNDK